MSTLIALAPSDDARAAPPRQLQLPFLDGLRGLAALSVTLCHLAYVSGGPFPFQFSLGWMHFAVYFVAIFIVLSGYCLMLPVARSADGLLRGGTKEFFRRRARRILPPYYAALALALFFALLQKFHSTRTGVAQAWWQSNLHFGNILAHLLLIHNLRPDWHQGINSVFWSVGLEWQIYFLFPFLLLPVFRRFGAMAALVTGLAVGLLPSLIFPASYAGLLRGWYVGLFAMGMVGAVISFSERPGIRHLQKNVPWGILTVVFTAAVVILTEAPARFGVSRLLWSRDVMIGAATTCLILFCTCSVHRGTEAARPVVLRFLQWPAVVMLGQFSYSLYLVHWPARWILSPLLQRIALPPMAQFAFNLCVVIPFVMFFAYGFYLVFERPFTSGYRRRASGTG